MLRGLRVLTLSWEYPPLVHGGLGRHVAALSTALAGAGCEVTVVTAGPAGIGVGTGTDTRAGAGAGEVADRVRVVRVGQPAVTGSVETLLAEVSAFNVRLAAAAVRTAGPKGPAVTTGAVTTGAVTTADSARFDVVHAHDWVVGQAAGAVADATGLPLVVTIHATEAGRHQGWLPSAASRAIHRAEAELAGRAHRVIACSQASADDVRRLFGVHRSRLVVIPGGVDPAAWSAASPDAASHGPPRDPLIVFAGRLEYEKGAQTLLAALPAIHRGYPGARVAIAGAGGYERDLRALAESAGPAGSVTFTGRLDAPELAALLRSADVVAVPSIYEPFGMVALEAIACGAPLVVSDTGGLRDLVQDGVSGLRVPPADPDALATAVRMLLADPRRTQVMARSAASRLARHAWPVIAERVGGVYRAAMSSTPPTPPPPCAIPTGNLLT